MFVQPNSPVGSADLLEQPVYCLLLASKEQYLPCHIRLPDAPERVPAILHGTQYYSLFRPIPEADKALEMVLKLGQRHHAAAITQNSQGYFVWVQELDALVAKEGRLSRVVSTFPAAHCLILTKTTQQRLCYLQVADLPERIAGITVSVQQQQKFYSLLRQESDLPKLLDTGAELTRWGEEIAIAPTKAGYAICVLEQTAVQVESPR